jgi:hypothetical protein
MQKFQENQGQLFQILGLHFGAGCKVHQEETGDGLPTVLVAKNLKRK